MAIQMTRAEYEAKYGANPVVQPITKAPIKMTRAEYEAKYGMSAQPEKMGVGGFLKEVGKDLARPIVTAGVQARAPFVKEENRAVDSKFLGETITPIKATDPGSLKQSIGLGAQLASFLPIAGATAKGVGIANQAVKGGFKQAVKQNIPRFVNGKLTIPTLMAEGGIGSGLFTAGQGLQEDKSAGQIIKDTAISTLTGGLSAVPFGIAGSTLGFGLNRVKGTINQSRRFKSAVGTPNPEMVVKEQEAISGAWDDVFKSKKSLMNKQEAIARFGEDPAITFGKLSYMPKVTAQGKLDVSELINNIDFEIPRVATQIQKTLDNFDKSAPTSALSSDDFLQRAINKAKSDPYLAGETDKTVSKLTEVIKDFERVYGKRFGAGTINKIRVIENGKVKKIPFTDPDKNLRQSVENLIGDTAREVIDEKVGDKTIRAINAELAKLYKVKNMARAVNGTPIEGGRLTELFTRLIFANAGMQVAGAVGTGGLSGIIGTALGWMGASAFLKMIRNAKFSGPIRTRILREIGLSQNLDAVLKELPDVEKRAFMREIAEVLKTPQLPAPKAGAPRTQFGSSGTINLPARTESTIARQTKNMGQQNAFAGFAGIEQDEEGNISFDPEKAVAGMLAMGTITSKQGDEFIKKFKDKAVKAISSGSDDLIKEARKYKSAGEFVKAQGNMQFVHNLSPEQIIKAKELGGLPAPSIATVNPNKTDFTRFGEISLIPKRSVVAGQKTVLSDAYTQTFGNIDKLPDNISTKRGAEWIDNAMQKEWGAGAKTPSGFVRSQLVEEVNNIADIQKNIRKLTSKSYGDKIKADIDYAIHSLAERINKNPNDLIEARKSRNIINDAILGKTDGLSQDIISEVNKLRQKIIKAPTEYFETKIGRNVGLDEFSHALVPKGTSQDVIKVLKDKGVIVIEKTGKNDLSSLTKSQLTDIWNKANKPKLSLKDNRGFIATGYKNEGNLTTKILKDLEGKTTVSKQYILDATNRGELKQVERDITRQVLEDMTDNSPLAQIIRRDYKSADDYIKSYGTEIYHGTNTKNAEMIKQNPRLLTVKEQKQFPTTTVNGTQIGISASKDRKISEYFASLQPTGKGEVLDLVLPSTAKIYKLPEGIESIDSLGLKELQVLKNRGFDAIEDVKNIGGESEIRVLTPSILKTKSELTDTYNKAKGDTINVKEFADKVKSELLPLKESSEYKTVGEFIKAQGKPLYHGSKSEIVGELKTGVGGSRGAGIYVTPLKEQASGYGKINEVFISKNAKTFDYSKMTPEDIGNDIKKYLNSKDIPFEDSNGFITSKLVNFDTYSKSKQALNTALKNAGKDDFFRTLGYDVAKFGDDESQILVINPKSVLTKSQLETIWKKLH